MCSELSLLHSEREQAVGIEIEDLRMPKVIGRVSLNPGTGAGAIHELPGESIHGSQPDSVSDWTAILLISIGRTPARFSYLMRTCFRLDGALGVDKDSPDPTIFSCDYSLI